MERIDYRTGPLSSFSIFYLIPVGLGATYLRRSLAFSVALIATTVWVLAISLR